VAEPSFEVRVDPAVHAAHPDYVALVLVASGLANSAEALITRVLKGQALPRVNALVDLYNAISVRHVVPLGGEDADRLEGPLHLIVAAGDEPFDPRGDGIDVEHAAAGEVVWRDELSELLRERWPTCHLDRLERHAP
jgi:DNA/RNA-binding domain of Phe-tRNA-synthetase-like protein